MLYAHHYCRYGDGFSAAADSAGRARQSRRQQLLLHSHLPEPAALPSPTLLHPLQDRAGQLVAGEDITTTTSFISVYCACTVENVLLYCIAVCMALLTICVLYMYIYIIIYM